MADARADGDEHAHGRLWDRRAARRGGDDDEGPVPVARVTLYRAAECHLCERALEVLREAQVELGFELQLIEIDGDAELEPRYRERIPVVEIDGEQAFTYFVEPDALRERLAVHSTGEGRPLAES